MHRQLSWALYMYIRAPSGQGQCVQYMYNNNMYIRAPIRGGGGAIIFTWRDLRPTPWIIIGPIVIISSKKVTLAVGRALQFY